MKQGVLNLSKRRDGQGSLFMEITIEPKSEGRLGMK